MSVFQISYRDRDGEPRRTRTWHCEFVDHLGRRQRVPGFRDKPSTRELERKLVQLVAVRATDATPDESLRRWVEQLAPGLRDRLAKMGLLTPKQVAGLRTLTAMLDEWEKHLLGK